MGSSYQLLVAALWHFLWKCRFHKYLEHLSENDSLEEEEENQERTFECKERTVSTPCSSWMEWLDGGGAGWWSGRMGEWPDGGVAIMMYVITCVERTLENVHEKCHRIQKRSSKSNILEDVSKVFNG